ncbi:hypothetical protein pb186bvf_008541 [Paramecium bursaria]
MGTCQAQQLGNNQLSLVDNGSRQTFVQTMSKEERKQHKLNQLAFLEERHQKLSENEYEYQNLFTNIRSNIMFDDNQFPPSSISIGDIQRQDDIQWKRIRQLIEHDKSIEQKFDTQCITRGTLNENNLRKIFFQQMLTQMSLNDGIIEQFLIIEKDDQILALDQSQDLQQPQSPQLGNRKQNQSHVMSTGKKKMENDQPKEPNHQFNLKKNGMYGVYLFKNKTRQQIVIDDYIPCNNQGTLFLQTQNNQFWPLILEKAAAKIAQSYQNLYNISIQQVVSMFFNSRVISLSVTYEKWIIEALENKIGIIFKNDNSFIFIYGPRSPGDKFYYQYDDKNYFQLNTYGQDIAKQNELTQNKKEFKDFIGDKVIYQDSIFMNFDEIKARFNMRFILNMKIMYPVNLEKSLLFKSPIHIEMSTFSIKEDANIQIRYKMTENISCFSITILQYKNGEDQFQQKYVDLVHLKDIDDVKRQFATPLKAGKQCLIIQTIMKNLNDIPDYYIRVKLSENIIKTASSQYQENLFDEFQKTGGTEKEILINKTKITYYSTFVGLQAQLNFKNDQFAEEEKIEIQFEINGVQLFKENDNRIFSFLQQFHIFKGIRISDNITIKSRARVAHDINCQARQEYNKFSNFFPIWVMPQELSQNGINIGLFINLKQINQDDLWYIYTFFYTTQEVNHKLKFDEIIIKIPNYQPDISIKLEGEYVLNSKESCLFKSQIIRMIESGDLEKAKFDFIQLKFFKTNQ